MPTWPESQRQETNEGDVTAVRETALQPSDHPVHTRVDAVFAAAFTFSVAAAESNCGGETGGSSLTMSFCLSKSPFQAPSCGTFFLSKHGPRAQDESRREAVVLFSLKLAPVADVAAPEQACACHTLH